MTRQVIRFVVAAGLVLAGRPDSAFAQSSTVSPVVGSRIRIEVPTTLARWFEGTVKEIDEQTLLIEIANHPAFRVQRQAITALDVSTGRRRLIGKGALIGAGIGAVMYAYGMRSIDDADANEKSAVLAAALGTGAFYGAAVGAFIKTDRWVAVPIAPAPVSSTAAKGRKVLTLVSLSF